jgi:hypothetical protein
MRLRRQAASPIQETLATWPLAGTHRMRWGQDEEGGLWVTVETERGDCQTAMPYQSYLEIEDALRQSARAQL